MQRQWREIGETDWEDCDEKWFDYCRDSPQHDTRTIPDKTITNKQDLAYTIKLKQNLENEMTDTTNAKDLRLFAESEVSPLVKEGYLMAAATIEALTKELARHNRFVVAVQPILQSEGYHGLSENVDELKQSVKNFIKKQDLNYARLD